MTAFTLTRCECGNAAMPDDTVCEWCAIDADQPPHLGHFSRFGTYWCDTCNSPLCDLS
jgi:hypothetical protein